MIALVIHKNRSEYHNFYLVEFEFAGSQVNLLVWLNKAEKISSKFQGSISLFRPLLLRHAKMKT